MSEELWEGSPQNGPFTIGHAEPDSRHNKYTVINTNGEVVNSFVGTEYAEPYLDYLNKEYEKLNEEKS